MAGYNVVSDLDLMNGGSKVIYDSPKARVEVLKKGSKLLARKTVKQYSGLEIAAEWLCAREVRALERLKGTEGIQQIVEQDSPISFLSEYVQGYPLNKAEHIPDDFFDNLREIMIAMHSEGVADLEFAHPPNVIINTVGDPVIIDLAASIIYDPSKGLMSRLVKPVFEYVKGLNHLYLIKRKNEYRTDLMNADEIQKLESAKSLFKGFKHFQKASRFVRSELAGKRRSKTPSETSKAH